ncbi:hypothetical protein ACFVHW_33270 [Streptomyces sp. NPDC127110]|uniref:hypothetical protein n=1 Tax=Streptomyces sp. NPDC127110 TaxID=3345362 RepID=UPI003638F527
MTRTALRRTSTTGRLPLGVLATARFPVVPSTSIVNAALPQIRAGLDLSDTGRAWTVNAHVLVFGALLPAAGRATCTGSAACSCPAPVCSPSPPSARPWHPRRRR